MSLRTTAAAAVACGALLALPAGASAGSFGDAVDKVRSHTTKADRGLDRAQRMLERNRHRDASRAYGQSRRELARARRSAARLARSADNSRERAAAASAQRRVAAVYDENVEQLAGMLDEARGRVESRIAQAALSDARGRDKAVAVLTALLEDGLPSSAATGISRALSGLVTDRDDEVEALGDALVSDEVSSRSKRNVARAVEESVDGQATAAAELSELLAGDDMPEQARPGLQRALNAISGERLSAAETLFGHAERIPEFIRGFVVEIIGRAMQDPQGFGQSPPIPPIPAPGGGSLPIPGGLPVPGGLPIPGATR